MFRKEDVRLPGEGGIALSAWLFMPEQRRSEARPAAWTSGGREAEGREQLAADCGQA